MIDPQELLVVVDEKNNPTSKLPRKDVHKKELWHRSCDIWIINSKDQILCQKRSFKKDINPGLWESFFGGHVLAGQNELESAVGELWEELGIKIKPEKLQFFKIVKDALGGSRKGFTHRQFKYVYLLKRDGDLDSFRLEKEEMDEIKWIFFKELTKILFEDKPKTWVLPIYAKDVLEEIAKQYR